MKSETPKKQFLVEMEIQLKQEKREHPNHNNKLYWQSLRRLKTMQLQDHNHLWKDMLDTETYHKSLLI